MTKLYRGTVETIAAQKQSVIGFWGAPADADLQLAKEKFSDLPFFDLDVFYGVEKKGLLPDAYCHIIRNCIDNAIALGPELKCVVAATGREKCDAGRFAAHFIKEATGVEVIVSTNEKLAAHSPALLCKAKGPLKKRAIRIMESIIEPLSEKEKTSAFMSQCTPTCGFWGTPPHPIELLDLFPETTHIFGWTRCVEQGRPADQDLELLVDQGLPTVFFSQGFCQKSLLARHLADTHGGLFVDTHDALGAATIAKVEAFLRLSV